MNEILCRANDAVLAITITHRKGNSSLDNGMFGIHVGTRCTECDVARRGVDVVHAAEYQL